MAKFHKGLQIIYFKDITQEKDSHNFLPSNGPPPTATHCLALHLEHCPNHHVLLVVVEIIDHGFSLLKHFSNAVGHGLVNVTLTAVKDFLKQDLSNFEMSRAAKSQQGRDQGYWQANHLHPCVFQTSFCSQRCWSKSPWKHCWYAMWRHPFRRI